MPLPLSFAPIVCQTITTASDKQVIAEQDGSSTILAHLLAIRSMLESMAVSHEQLHEAVHSLQAIDGNVAAFYAEPKFVSSLAHSSVSMPDAGGSVLSKGVAGATMETAGVEEPIEAGVEGEEQEMQELANVLSRKSTMLCQDADQANHELISLIKLAEEEKTAEAVYSEKSMWQKFRSMNNEQLDVLVDAVTGILVLANATVIALSVDGDTRWAGWAYVDVAFAVFFVIELITKVRITGCRAHFSTTSHIIDFIVVVMDVTQIVLVLAGDQLTEMGLSFAVFRLVRLARLGRIHRVLRLGLSQDLVRMANGLSGCMSTLVWSSLLVFFITFVMGLVFRESIGREEYREDTVAYFDTVPRAVMTLFRCSFGDCATTSGTPIFELVHVHHGVGYNLLYGAFWYFMVVGVFNVISAIFVESTMAVAMDGEKIAKASRIADRKLWATRIATLIEVILDYVEPSKDHEKLTDEMDSISNLNIERAQFDEILQDERAIVALDELDICREDHAYLSNILDPDNSGVMSITEIVTGIEQLRGEPRRSDIVCVDLMVRSLQQTINTMAADIKGLKVKAKQQLVTLATLVKTEVKHHQQQRHKIA